MPEAIGSALWGKKGGNARPKALVAAAAAILALSAPSVANAGTVPSSLLHRAKAHPDRMFDVIVQTKSSRSAKTSAMSRQGRGTTGRRLGVISSVSTRLSGAELLRLQGNADVVGVAPDSPVRLTESNPQEWVDAVGAEWYWSSAQRRETAGSTPTIAVVDSGIDGTRVADFGGRVLKQVDLTSGTGPNSPGDGRGHGTMVASLAAGGAEGHTGVDPEARLVSLDVVDDNGEGQTSDVIAAIDWILKNRDAYDIRVVNFSLQASVESSFMFDPLSLAVERLWLNGIVVVAAAGNYGSEGDASGVLYAPASDPFVITVGAVDTGGNADVANDVAAPWSAWGRTPDGFLKPELSAPGRYLIAAAPQESTLSEDGGQDSSLVGQGYLQLSGTSFSAPIVAGSAAALLALHPDWTPDQVKGALMTSANPLPAAPSGSVGSGEVDLESAVTVTDPPNPNAALDAYVEPTEDGPVFDSRRWATDAKEDASWSSASWSSAAWDSASWSSASWSSSASSSASWSSASWTSSISGSSTGAPDNALRDDCGGE